MDNSSKVSTSAPLRKLEEKTTDASAQEQKAAAPTSPEGEEIKKRKRQHRFNEEQDMFIISTIEAVNPFRRKKEAWSKVFSIVKDQDWASNVDLTSIQSRYRNLRSWAETKEVLLGKPGSAVLTSKEQEKYTRIRHLISLEKAAQERVEKEKEEKSQGLTPVKGKESEEHESEVVQSAKRSRLSSAAGPTARQQSPWSRREVQNGIEETPHDTQVIPAAPQIAFGAANIRKENEGTERPLQTALLQHLQAELTVRREETSLRREETALRREEIALQKHELASRKEMDKAILEALSKNNEIMTRLLNFLSSKQ